MSDQCQGAVGRCTKVARFLVGVLRQWQSLEVLLLSSICGSTRHITLECYLCNIVAECSGVGVVARKG